MQNDKHLVSSGVAINSVKSLVLENSSSIPYMRR